MNLTDTQHGLRQELLKRLYIDDDDIPPRHAENLRLLAAANFREEVMILERMQHPVATYPGVRGRLFQAIKDIAKNGDIVGKFTNTKAAIVYTFNVFCASYGKPPEEQLDLHLKAEEYLYKTYPVIDVRHYEVPLPGGQYE